MSKRVPYQMTTARALQIASMTQKLHEESEMRMRVIVALMCEGLCDKLISRRTGLAVSSIKHKRSLFMALHQIKSRTQLGVWAVRNGYDTLPEPATDLCRVDDSRKYQRSANELPSKQATCVLGALPSVVDPGFPGRASKAG